MRPASLAVCAVLAVAVAGCGSAAPVTISGASTAAQTSAPPAVASPASTAATLTGRCAMGWEWVPNTTKAATGDFVPGFPPGSHGEPYPPGTSPSTGDAALAYQVTLTNNSTSNAAVAGFAVAFYFINGSESGSDDEHFGSQFITADQSLDFTVIEDHTILGYGDDPNQQLAQTSTIPGGSASCQFLQWSGGGG